jgi:hypothetical protein
MNVHKCNCIFTRDDKNRRSEVNEGEVTLIGMQSIETSTQKFTQKSIGKTYKLTKILLQPPTPGGMTLRDTYLVEKLFLGR